MCTMTVSMPTYSRLIAIRCGGIGVSRGAGAGAHLGTITAGMAQASTSLIGIVLIIITTIITIIIRTMVGLV